MLLDGEADIRMPGTLPSSPSVTLEYSNSSIIDTYYSVMTLNSREDLYYEDYDTFKTLKVGISQNLYNNISAMEDFKKINIGEEQIKLYEGYNECREALKKGEVDAIISNIMDLDSEMKILEKFSSVSNYISMVIGSSQMQLINDALITLKQNEPTFMSDLNKKWFPNRVIIPFTKEESEFLDNLDNICFSFRDKQGYLSIKDKSGKFEGFYPEVAKKICDKLGVEYEETDLMYTDVKGISVYPDFYYD